MGISKKLPDHLVTYLSCYIHPKAHCFRWSFHEGTLEMWIPKVPMKGKVNRDLIKYLGDLIRMPRSNISVIKGHKNRHKIVQVSGISKEEIYARLVELNTNGQNRP